MSEKRKNHFVNPDRLVKPDDRFQEGFPGLVFNEEYTFDNTDGNVLITDPTYLADIYNSKDDKAFFLRQNGVVVMNFGGDTNCPVLYQNPFIVLPVSSDVSKPDPKNVKILASDIGTDSGSFIFLPITNKIPKDLLDAITHIVAEDNGVILQLQKGVWVVFYEQGKVPNGERAPFYRNIVATLK